MKKTILIFVITISGCQYNDKPDTDSIKDNIAYFKDEQTGLCFAAVNSTNTKSLSNSSSIACVPCDNLIKIGIK